MKCQETMSIQEETYYSCHQNYYKSIGIDLSRQENATISQQINFTGIFGKDDDAVILFAS